MAKDDIKLKKPNSGSTQIKSQDQLDMFLSIIARGNQKKVVREGDPKGNDSGPPADIANQIINTNIPSISNAKTTNAVHRAIIKYRKSLPKSLNNKKGGRWDVETGGTAAGGVIGIPQARVQEKQRMAILRNKERAKKRQEIAEVAKQPPSDVDPKAFKMVFNYLKDVLGISGNDKMLSDMAIKVISSDKSGDFLRSLSGISGKSAAQPKQDPLSSILKRRR